MMSLHEITNFMKNLA